MDWIVQGESFANIIEAANKMWPGADNEKRYYFALNRVADAAKTETQLIYGWCLMARQNLYAKMLAIGDFSGALAATSKIETLADKLAKLKPEVEDDDSETD